MKKRHDSGFSKRWTDIRQIHSERKVFYRLFAGSVLLLALIGFGTSRYVLDEDDLGYETNLFTEALGVYASIGITVFFIDILYELRDKDRLRTRLKREASSRANAIAVGAIEWLRAEGWLEGEDGLLKGENLNHANLQGANLCGANLQGTHLQKAQLLDSDLSRAKLIGAQMFEADLRAARLLGTDLQSANLKNADLRKAVMNQLYLGEEQEMGTNLFADDLDTSQYHADLRYADMEGAYLEGATLPNVKRLYWTKLPLGERCHHSFNVEKLKRYTKRNHPEFEDTLQQVESRRFGIRAVASRGPHAHLMPEED